MQHLKKGRKFGRVRNQRKALIKSLATAFFTHGKIVTTEAKAKEIRPMIERCITKAKSPALTERRALLRIFSARILKKVYESSALHAERKGGYTRIIKLGARLSDGSKMAQIELLK